MKHTIPGFPELKVTVKATPSSNRPGQDIEVEIFVHDALGNLVGTTGAVLTGEYPFVSFSEIWSAYRGKGLYPKMLMILLAEVQARGYKGIVSRGMGRMGIDSNAAWKKFAAREPRVTSYMTPNEKIDYYLAGLHSSAKEPVYMECESHFSRLLNETIYGKCVWHVDPSVVSALIECKKTKTMNVLSRNMDSQRGIYPWRLSFFDKETGEAIGHRYGRTASDAVNFNYYDHCSVVDVKRK